MADKDLSNIASRRHPEYAERKTHWEFLESCYEGGRDWFQTNIFKYMKEGSVEFTDRKERAYRFNHTREVVDLVNKYVFRTDVSRNEVDAPDSVKTFWKSATSDGQDIDYLMTQISKRTSISGRIYVVVDNNVTRAPDSKAEEKKSGVKTYAYWVGPQDVLDMSFDDLGNLNWILIREKYREDEDPFGDENLVQQQFRLWTKNDWYLFRHKLDAEGKIVKNEATQKPMVEQTDFGKHGLGRVPVVPVDHMDDDNLYNAPALINDIAYLDRSIANYLSNLDAIIQDQTFSQLAMPAQGLMPGEEEDITKKMTEMGTKRIFLYNGEAGAEPKFLSPDPRQAQLIITTIRTIINEIYHTVGMAGERTKQDNSMGIDNSSGVAKAYDFERVNALLINKAKVLSKAELAILDLVGLWNGDEVQDGLIKWSENFDVRGLADEFEIASNLALISAPETMRREQMKGLRDKLFPTSSDELKGKMEGEIDNDWPPQPEAFTFASDPGSDNEDEGTRESAPSDDSE